jgi:hypothetical protein
MVIAFFTYAKDFLGHLDLFAPSSALAKHLQLVLLVVALPRLLALAAVLTVMIILVRSRDAAWLSRLKMVFGVIVLIATISVALDASFFPKALLLNCVRLFMLCVWFVYLCISRRVRRVFEIKNWTNPLV